jgi:hypothetical protein
MERQSNQMNPGEGVMNAGKSVMVIRQEDQTSEIYHCD